MKFGSWTKKKLCTYQLKIQVLKKDTEKVRESLRQRQWKIKAVEVWSTVVLSSHPHLWCGRGLHLMHVKNRSPPINYEWPTQKPKQQLRKGRRHLRRLPHLASVGLDFFFSGLDVFQPFPPGVGPSRFAETQLSGARSFFGGKSHFEKLSK